MSHLELQSKCIRKANHCSSSQRIWKFWLICFSVLSVLTEIRACHFTTEESKARKPSPSFSSHLMTDLVPKFWFSVSVLISLITTKKSVCCLSLFSEKKYCLYFEWVWETREMSIFRGAKWTHDAKCKIYTFLLWKGLKLVQVYVFNNIKVRKEDIYHNP